MDKKKKIILISAIIVSVLLLIIGSTVAYFGWQADKESLVSVTVSSGTGSCTLKSDNEELIAPSSTRDGGRIIKLTAKQQMADKAGIVWKMVINEIEGLKDESFIYELVNTTTGISYGSGNFSDISSGDTITFSTEEEVLGYNKDYEFTLYLWIDGVNFTNPVTMADQIFDFDMYCELTGTDTGTIIDTSETLVDHITNLYTDAAKTTVTNNSIVYNYAASVLLMNDRLGGTTEDYNAGNIRYYGANPNNYIDIGDVSAVDTPNWVDSFLTIGVPEDYIPTTEEGCKEFVVCSNLVTLGFFTDEATCEASLPTLVESVGFSSTDELCSITPAGTSILYRIIGLFKDVELEDGTKEDLVKIVRDEPIGIYSWDQSDSTINNGYGVNEWSQADLMKLLNPGYESETVGGSLYWNSTSGTCYGYDESSGSYTSISCDFTNKGLSTKVQNEIVSVKWNLGGWNSSSLFANDIYSYERLGNVIENPSDGITRTTTWIGKIALAYPSDYGYAADFNTCSGYTLFNYDNSNCTSVNWMKSILGTSSYGWLLTPCSDNSGSAWNVISSGGVSRSYYVYYASGVAPVLYLDSELAVESGTGASDDPYRISVS